MSAGIVVTFSAIFAIFAPSGGKAAPRPTSDTVPVAPPPTHVPSMLTEYDAQETVKGRLKDPESAQFTNVRRSRDASKARAVICGSVNARNGFGGYTGAVRFIVVGGAAVLATDYSRQEFNASWQEFCG